MRQSLEVRRTDMLPRRRFNKALVIFSLLIFMLSMIGWKLTGVRQCLMAHRSLELDLYSSVDLNLTLLGRPIQRCGHVATFAEEEDIFVSIKTTQKNHDTRVPIIALSWLQTVQPQQVNFVTDNVSADEDFYQIASEVGFNVKSTDCLQNYSVEGLCCKAKTEFMQYYRSTTESGELHRWFCHFDDDVYVNVPVLVATLKKYRCESWDGGIYFGRWPENIVISVYKNGAKLPSSWLRGLGFIRRSMEVKWATGAAYCISSTIMKKMRDLLKKNTYEDYCRKLDLGDDMVPAVLAALLGYTLTDNLNVKTQYDKLEDIPRFELQDMITISYQDENIIKLPDARFPISEDPSRFLSYHCLLYPSTSWCSKSKHDTVTYTES